MHQAKTGSFKKFLKRLLIFLLVTLLLLLIALYGVIRVFETGPSETARNLFVRSMNETSALKFVPRICLSEEEVSAILSNNGAGEISEMDVTLLSSNQEDLFEEEDIWATQDEDGDGIILEEVHGSTYSGYMMIIKDPMRLKLAIDVEHYGYKGHTVEEFCQMFNAVACINGGGFEDTNGQGDGSIPDSTVVYEGEFLNNSGTKYGFVGIDDQGNLHVDCQTSTAI